MHLRNRQGQQLQVVLVGRVDAWLWEKASGSIGCSMKQVSLYEPYFM